MEDKNYVKKIIEKYHLFLKEWGHSDNWSQSQFKTLEDMIFAETKIQINASTLKRFFQQRTGNPQLATKDALCKFLGYAGYSDFVLKMTDVEKGASERSLDIKEKLNPHEVVVEKKRLKWPPNTNHKYTSSLIILSTAILLCFFNIDILKDWYNKYQISRIKFVASNTRGTVPLTISITYNIPSNLFDEISIVYEEANGDATEKKLNKDINIVNASYIYEGEAYCYLKYKGETIRTIPVVALRPGWSIYAREERRKIFEVFPVKEAYHENHYLSLPIEKIPIEARTNHLFVSYVFYRENLVDGDNFIFEAKVRNSTQEHSIPCSDIIMYIYSDNNMHGFAINEDGYSYIKFLSGEKSITGAEHNLSQFNMDSSQWHIMCIKVVDKNTYFYMDGKELLCMNYNESLGMANELILRFKGCGAVDYVKVSKLDGEVVYQEDFNNT